MSSKAGHLLVAAIARLEEQRAAYLVERALLHGESRADLLERSREGVDRVGRRYASGEYFLADMLMAAHIFRRILGMLFDSASGPDEQESDRPPIVIGTVEGDIHDIGKNIAVGYLRCEGLPLVDLGSNVPAERFVAEVAANRSSIVCLSGLMNTCFASMRTTVSALGAAGLRDSTAVIIGGHVSEDIRRLVGADYWAADCVQGAEICRRLLEPTEDAVAG
jgi:methanogenic corrinoid protein MtbC1